MTRLQSYQRAAFVAFCMMLAVTTGVPFARAADAGPSFRQEVVPVLTRFGCNAGGCHGKLSGQNGFRLSLRGYAPEMDFEQLTTDLLARRIDFGSPQASLLLKKPIGDVPHEGGRRFSADSPAYKVLLDWVEHRAPGPDAAESDSISLEVSPGDQTLKPGDKVQLKAVARWPGGVQKDVTWLTQFFSNDGSTVTVTENGLVKSLRHGQASVRAHFQGQVAVLTFTSPYENAMEEKQFAARKNLVDDHVFDRLKTLKIPPSQDCGDEAFVRRVYLDVTGTLPTIEQAAAFVADDRSDKRARLIDELLASPQFVDYWTLNLADLLQNRKERDHDVRGVKGVRAFHAWLREQVAQNRPWNELAKDLLTVAGDVRDNPQVGYFIYNVGEKQRVEESDIADSVAQAFLGARIGCARCHNHPLERYTQDDYYHFAAFFSKVSMKRTDPEKGSTLLKIGTREEEDQQKQVADAEKKLADAEADASGKSNDKGLQKKLAEAKKRLEDAKKRQADLKAKAPEVRQPRTNKMMAPQPLDRSAVALEAGGDPRAALVDWMTDPKNDQFAAAMVNRLWRHYMGIGLVEPVDDLRSSNPASNPALLKALAAEFAGHGYDLKHVMRLILTSRAYQLSSDTLPENELDRKFHSHYYAKRLPAEVMNDAVSSVTGVPDTFKGYPAGVRAVQLPEVGVESYFLTVFGRSDRVTACACERNNDVTLSQVLHLQGGTNIAEKVKSDDGRLKALLKSEKDDAKVTESLFQMTLSRKPTNAEALKIREALANGADRNDVFADLFWALMNTKEFSFNH